MLNLLPTEILQNVCIKLFDYEFNNKSYNFLKYALVSKKFKNIIYSDQFISILIAYINNYKNIQNQPIIVTPMFYYNKTIVQKMKWFYKVFSKNKFILNPIYFLQNNSKHSYEYTFKGIFKKIIFQNIKHKNIYFKKDIIEISIYNTIYNFSMLDIETYYCVKLCTKDNNGLKNYSNIHIYNKNNLKDIKFSLIGLYNTHKISFFF